MLEIHLCKPAIYELRILGGGKFECYKSVGRTTKKVGPSSVGESKRKGGGHDFWLKFSWGDLEKIMSFHRALDFIFIFCTHFAPFFHYDFLFINSFSFIINNIFFPQERKGWKFFRNTFIWFFHLYAKHIQYERRAEVITNFLFKLNSLHWKDFLCTWCKQWMNIFAILNISNSFYT